MRVLPERIALVMGFAILMSSSAQAMPTGSFLRKPAYTVQQLVAQVDSDAVVRDRFERHFRMDQSQLDDYFHSLHLAKLAQDGVYTIYNVHSDNVIRGRQFMVKRGTVVFADAQGRPILKLQCGNPFVFGVPTISPEAKVTTPVNGKTPVVAGESVDMESTAPAEPSFSPAPAAPVGRTAPVAPAAGSGAILGGGAAGLGGFFLPLVFLGAVATHTHTHTTVHTPPAPEPATMVILGVGAAAVALKKRRKSK